jgi:hypothetical protein
MQRIELYKKIIKILRLKMQIIQLRNCMEEEEIYIG